MRLSQEEKYALLERLHRMNAALHAEHSAERAPDAVLRQIEDAPEDVPHFGGVLLAMICWCAAVSAFVLSGMHWLGVLCHAR